MPNYTVPVEYVEYESDDHTCSCDDQAVVEHVAPSRLGPRRLLFRVLTWRGTHQRKVSLRVE